jgi:hypothetical protein
LKNAIVSGSSASSRATPRPLAEGVPRSVRLMHKAVRRSGRLSILRSFALNILRFNKVNDVADALWRNAMNLNRVLAYGGT